MRRTQGATIATVGKAMGQVVMQLVIHCWMNPEWNPSDMARTKPETKKTMMAESRALNRSGE